ncbi:ankyrin repeat-containing domain protein [Diaporthe sp. PMI_573]|nr:ankyrin repeat-containing domain protein [Diaporthaceae sp. PMI_573]
MLEAGADPNAYTRYDRTSFKGLQRRRTPLQASAWRCSTEIIELLLLAGSDVNAPAKGYNGFTALQASCRNRTYSSQDRQRKLKAIRLLLAHGADVNAAPARKKGKTALQEAAETGDLAVAELLLFHNPMADVNAPPYTQAFSIAADDERRLKLPRLGTALDCAARKGRIDMVKLLLNCNALSHYRGKTGYDGAVQEARSRGHLAVADLICQHAEDARRSDTSPRLSQPCGNTQGYRLSQDESSEQSKAEEASTSFSDTDQMDAPKDFWEGDVVGTHQANRFVE